MDGFEEAKQQEFNRLQAENAQLLRDIETYRKRADYAAQSQSSAHSREADALARAERAEDRERTALRERDEARQYLDVVRQCRDINGRQRDENFDARERAEADCAVMREKMLRAADALRHGGFVDLAVGADPGSALLERLRAAESSRDENWREVGALMGVLYYVDKATHDAVVKSGGPAAEAARVGERLRAAEAVVGAVRRYLDPKSANDMWPVRNALASYDALSAKGEASEVLCEHGAGEGVECYVCHPKAVE